MRYSRFFFLAFYMVFLLAGMAIGADSDVVIQNGNVSSGQTLTYSVRHTITAGPDYTVQNGGELNLTAGDNIRLLPGFHAVAGSKVVARMWPDSQAPVVVSSYPGINSSIATQGGNVDFLVTYNDTGSGIYSVKLLNQNGQDITSQATIGTNTIQFTVQTPSEGAHYCTLQLEDMAGNTASINLNFTVDNTAPVTTASVPGGSFSSTVSVNLTCSEAATVYYSTDGYPPSIGAANTTAHSAPVQSIVIDRSKRLQFFAVDAAGNLETVKSEVYLLGGTPESVSGLTAVYNSSLSRVELSWSAAGGSVSGYRVYRCNSDFDRTLLEESRQSSYPPPAELRLSSNLTTTSFNDSTIVPSATYRYGVTLIDNNGKESRITGLIPVTISTNSVAQSKNEAIARAQIWLEAQQNKQGYWGTAHGTRTLATTQSLNALWRAGINNAGVRQGLFYLRGVDLENNDYLSRKILTLNNFGQNVDDLVNRLITQAYISNNNILGWGIEKRFQWDAFDTAIGALAVECGTESILSLNNNGFDSLRYNAALLSSDSSGEIKKFGWLAGQEGSIYVSARVYQALNEYYETTVFSNQWITDSQNQNGSFGNGLIDTGAVLLWLTIPEQAKTNAINYLVSQQNVNGSWDNDPYTTGFCMEALLR